jgi:hypothetical protein
MQLHAAATSPERGLEGERPRAATSARPSVGHIALMTAVFAAALVFIGLVIRPFATGLVAFDGASSVLYFDRIVSGQRLEAFVNTTPKPLLTLVYGVAHSLTGDWRAISLLTILAAAVAVALGARLALDLGGPGALAVAAILLVADGNLLVEISWAHALPWAVACWLAAGVALTRPRPRYGLAGVALLLGALARPETFLLLAVSTACLGWLRLRGRTPPGAWRMMVGWLALAVLAGHDLILTGDPLYWLRVGSIYADGAFVRSVAVVARMVAGPFVGGPLLTIAAIVGVVSLSRTPPGRVVALGLVTIAVGTGLLLIGLAARGNATLYYYLHPIELALGLAAAFGVAAVADLIVAAVWRRRDGRRTERLAETPGSADHGSAGEPGVGADRRVRTATSAVLAAAIGLVVIWPLLVSPATLDAIATQRQIALDSDRTAATLARLVRDRGILATEPGDPERSADPAGYRILVPRTVQTRLAVDLGLPITVIGPLVPDRATTGLIHPDLVVYHARAADPASGLPPRFEGDQRVTVEGVAFDPVVADPAHGVWIWASAAD